MLDQTFSLKNFERIYDAENRKGHIDMNDMPEDYRTILADIKATNESIKNFSRARTNEEDECLKNLKEKLKNLKAQKQDFLKSYLSKLSSDVMSPDFEFSISKFILGGKEYFKLDKTTHAHFFAMKQLQYNIRRTFKIKQEDRHAILSNLKTLLNPGVSVYVIRTDISSFYESIKQDMLLEMIDNNTLLSYRSRSFIKAMLKLYEDCKDTSIVAKGIGIPRGLGISAYLAELYMRDLDTKTKNRPEVIFYSRYVDDIFMILSHIPVGCKDIEYYYNEIVADFSKAGLSLKMPSDGTGKCFVLDFTKNNSQEIDFLGYELRMKSVQGKFEIIFALTSGKKQQILSRVDNAIHHFDMLSVKSIKQAKRDLIDSLNYISGNARLYKSKAGVKVGLYYNNDLLDEESDLDYLTQELHKKFVTPYSKLSDVVGIKNAMEKRIQKVDFKERWKDKKMYKFRMQRMKEFKEWL